MKIEQDDITFQGIVTFLVSPKKIVQALKNEATPSIPNREVLESSGSVVTITNFIGGQDGQTIRILGDGTTTIKNNTNIVTNTGADKLLTLNKFYRFTYINSKAKWIEDA